MSYSISDLAAQMAAYNASLPAPAERPALPEFGFSPRLVTFPRTALCAACEMPIHEAPGESNHWYFGDDGPFCPVCAQKKRMADLGRKVTYRHTPPPMPIRIVGPVTDACPVTLPGARKPSPKREVGKAEHAHINLQPFFSAPIEEHAKPTIGTTKPFGLGAYLSRVDEINAIASTQFLELETVQQELARSGIASISLSSSSRDDDDDEITVEIANHDARRYGTPFTTADLAPIVRRIEWEKFILACSNSTRIYAKVKPDGKIKVACENRTWTPNQVSAYAKKIKRLLAARSAEELENDRARAAHYGAAVWARMTPEQQQGWRDRARRARAYLDIADTNIERVNRPGNWALRLRNDPDEEFAQIAEWTSEDANDGGPEELGLHWLDIDLEEDGHFEYATRYEPSETELWGFEEAV